MLRSKRHLYAAAAGAVVIATLLLAAGSASGAGDPGSFKCYTTLGADTNTTVSLHDEFDAAGVSVNLVAHSALNLCTPAAVTHKGTKGSVTNPESFLTLYRLTDTNGDSPTARASTAVVSNVFGAGQNLALSTTQSLGVPTGTGGVAAHDLENFKCYALIRGDAERGGTKVSDTFGTDKTVKVLEAVRLCNPVAVSGVPVINAAGHLVCYNLKTEAFSGSLTVQNRFGSELLSLGVANMLCVPSTLDSWAPVTP